MTTMIEMDGCRNRWMRLLKRCAVIGDSTINGIMVVILSLHQSGS